MSFAATAAAAASTAIAAGGSIASGAMSASAAGKSAKEVKKAAGWNEYRARLQQQDSMNALAPWISPGLTAQALINYGLGLGGPDDALRQAQAEYDKAKKAYDFALTAVWSKKKQAQRAADIKQKENALAVAEQNLNAAKQAAAAIASGGVRPGEFSENLWREFTPEDARNDPVYQFLLDKGLVSEGKWETDPGYLFRLSEGQKVLENSAAARGGLLSGQTGKALQQYGQNFASNEFGNIYDRYRNLLDAAYGRHLDDYKGRVAEREAKFDKLTGQSGTGLKTTGTLAELAFGSQAKSNQDAMNAAELAAKYNMAGAKARADAFGNALNSIGSLAMYAGSGGFGGGSGGGVNTSTFASNLGANTAFQNFGPKFGSPWD